MSLLEAARSIADTVLYEGYLLYPYRSSSSKNQVRWQYGIVGPAGGVEAGAGEEPALQTECLVSGAGARMDVYLRFLQVQARTVEAGSGSSFRPVAELRVAGTTWLPWDEAVEQEIAVSDVTMDELLVGRSIDVEVPGGEDVELLREATGEVGRVVRRREPLRGRLHLAAVAHPGSPVSMLRCRLDNTAAYRPAAPDPAPDEPGHADPFDQSAHRAAGPRDVAARQSFVGTHLLLVVRDGAFVSLIDPPAWAAAAAGACTNRRAWPVLVGRPGDTDVVLCLPIILSDYPELAPESPGSLYDSTEIDEILTLRVMTMTEEEKAEARATDPRAAEIIDRSDLMPPEVFEKLHGALRSFGAPVDAVPSAPSSGAGDIAAPNVGVDGVPWWGEDIDASVSPESDTVMIGTVEVSKGSRVRLRPNRRADAQDLFLADRTAVVTRVYSDIDGGTHVAVVLEDDEMAEINDWYGRYYYFAPDEVEPLQQRSAPQAAIRGDGMSARILIAGIGNIFLGDDGFGSEAARRLAQKPLPDGVTVVDYGIRGMHLAYDLLDGYEALVIIDAVPHQGAPGELVVMEVTAEHLGHNAGELDAHGMEPTAVLASLGMLGGQLPVTYIVGCQPASLDENIGLTPSVAAAIEGAVAAVHALLNQQLSALLSPADGHLQVAAASRERNDQ